MHSQYLSYYLGLLAFWCVALTWYNMGVWHQIHQVKAKRKPPLPFTPVSPPTVLFDNTPWHPLVCVVVTFKQPKLEDWGRQIAHKNVARMYKSMSTHGVAAFLATTGSSPVDSEKIWREAGNSGIIPGVETNGHGTPFLWSLFERVEQRCPSSTPFVAYANADIMFDTGLVNTLTTLKKWGKDRLLVVGQRRNHELKGGLTWEEIQNVPSDLFLDVAQDYFIMSRGLLWDWSTLPPYVIGRRAYDNALVDWAFHNANLVDATETITALHQTTQDGNYAGHAEDLVDKEYNVNLPGAKYDHDSVKHAKYTTQPCFDTHTCVMDSGQLVWSPHFKENISYRGLHPQFSALPDPVFVVFGNDAFLPMLRNFLCNTAAFPLMQRHTLLLVTTEGAADELLAMGVNVTVGVINKPSLTLFQRGLDYNTLDYKRLMFLRGEVLVSLLDRGKSIVWMEPDAHYLDNLLNYPIIVETKDDVVLFWDHLSWGGGFIRFAPTPSAKKFYVRILELMNRTGLDDQQALNEVIKKMESFSTFDQCLFRSGAAFHKDGKGLYHDKCQGIRTVVQQHNWMVGAQSKIEFAKEHGAWYLSHDDLTCRARDLRVVVMTMNRPASLGRLLGSLNSAFYKPDYPMVDLSVNVDGVLPHQETMDLLMGFKWRHGLYEVNAWKAQKGIYGQWVDSWPSELYPPWLYKAVVLLEDDLEVSPFYAKWFIEAHEVYKGGQIGAVTGMRAQLVAKTGVVKKVEELVPKRVSAFGYRLIATWSMSPTYAMWTHFRGWLKEVGPSFVPLVEGIVPSEWYSSFMTQGKEATMWEMWFVRFAHDFNYYTIYPWVEEGRSTVICNWREPGLHFHGEASRDFPLMQTWHPRLLEQKPLPVVEWDLAFYVCLTDSLFGQFSNQLLTIAVANQYAKERSKFLRLQSTHFAEDRSWFLIPNWDVLFDADAIPFMEIGPDIATCSEQLTYGNVYMQEFLPKRQNVGWFTIPNLSLAIQHQAIKVVTSVHGRSLDHACNRFPLLCSTGVEYEPYVPNLCYYNQTYVRQVFNIEESTEITLFTDGQNPQLDATYQIRDDHSFPVQLWSMVLSKKHIGNPRSSMDYLISRWKHQLGLHWTIEPSACYEPNTIPPIIHFVHVQPYLSEIKIDPKLEKVKKLALAWTRETSMPVTTMIWTRDEIVEHLLGLVPLLEKIKVSAFIADIVRYHVVHKWGGMYLDTDEFPIHDPSALWGNRAFTVCQTPFIQPTDSWQQDVCDSVASAIIAAPKRHLALECAVNLSVAGAEDAVHRKETQIGHLTGPAMWTTCVKKYSETIQVLPSPTFLPCPCCENCHPEDYKGIPGVFGMHAWDHSWW